MIKGISLTDIFIDCKDPENLREFYYKLTGWERVMKYDTPGLVAKDNLVILFVECDVPHVPPVWPEEAGKQQKQIHLDFAVEDLSSAVLTAIRLGAKKAPNQFGGDFWVTLLDPEGHPFCLGVDE
jgi:hypothetical protein